MSINAPLPNNLQYLQNLIDGAKSAPSGCEKLLRKIIKSAADEAPAADIIRIAETIFQCGVAVEESRWSSRN